MGIDYEEKAFFDILVAVAEKFEFEFPENENIELAKEIRAAMRDKEKIRTGRIVFKLKH